MITRGGKRYIIGRAEVQARGVKGKAGRHTRADDEQSRNIDVSLPLWSAKARTVEEQISISKLRELVLEFICAFRTSHFPWHQV